MRIVVDFLAPFAPRNPGDIAGLDHEAQVVDGQLVASRLLRFSTSIVSAVPGRAGWGGAGMVDRAGNGRSLDAVSLRPGVVGEPAVGAGEGVDGDHE